MDSMSLLKSTLEDALRSIAEKKNVSPMDIETATKALCALEQIRVMSNGHSETYRHVRYDDGYSGHSIKDRMVAKMEEMYDQAKSEHEKQVIDEWIKKMESNK